mmetsp:Transcript_516/g.1815  ORF Transcript_516/g.1815 Transcript_516/m.1815 type:complete len:200 (+) Transcript_516:21316-21915(+)
MPRRAFSLLRLARNASTTSKASCSAPRRRWSSRPTPSSPVSRTASRASSPRSLCWMGGRKPRTWTCTSRSTRRSPSQSRKRPTPTSRRFRRRSCSSLRAWLTLSSRWDTSGASTRARRRRRGSSGSFNPFTARARSLRTDSCSRRTSSRRARCTRSSAPCLRLIRPRASRWRVAAAARRDCQSASTSPRQAGRSRFSTS